MVFAARCSRRCGAFLSRASAAHSARKTPDARSGRSHPQELSQASAARSRSRGRTCLSPPPSPQLAETFWSFVPALSRVLLPKSFEPPLRTPPRLLVCPGASGRRLCRDIRGMAHATFKLEVALQGLACVEEACIPRLIDERSRRHKAGLSESSAPRTPASIAASTSPSSL